MRLVRAGQEPLVRQLFQVSVCVICFGGRGRVHGRRQQEVALRLEAYRGRLRTHHQLLPLKRIQQRHFLIMMHPLVLAHLHHLLQHPRAPQLRLHLPPRVLLLINEHFLSIKPVKLLRSLLGRRKWRRTICIHDYH